MQKDMFLQSEGDAWYERNAKTLTDKKLDAGKMYIQFIRDITPPVKRVLEIGCGNGYRLEQLHKEFGFEVYGLDPSEKALQDGKERYAALNLFRGVANKLPFDANYFDVVIFGFCLSLCDRDDLFLIASEADRVLSTPGRLITLDFFSTINYRNTYGHCQGLYSYKMDYSSMFLWHPSYALVSHTSASHEGVAFHSSPNERLAFSVIAKLPADKEMPTDPYACPKT